MDLPKARLVYSKLFDVGWQRLDRTLDRFGFEPNFSSVSGEKFTDQLGLWNFRTIIGTIRLSELRRRTQQRRSETTRGIREFQESTSSKSNREQSKGCRRSPVRVYSNIAQVRKLQKFVKFECFIQRGARNTEDFTVAVNLKLPWSCTPANFLPVEPSLQIAVVYIYILS